MTNAAQAIAARHPAQRVGQHRRTWADAISQRWQRLVARWNALQQARAERRLDRWYAHRRDAHERYLSRAQDHYELERFERAWERNPEWWR